MSEKSIIFSQEFIPKIEDGTKTQTRRPIKGIEKDKFSMERFGDFLFETENGLFFKKFPEYQTGDILWVKETWCYCVVDLINRNQKDTSNSYKWQPAQTMPKEAARLWLKVTGVRVEKLQDITDEDLKKEGIHVETPSVSIRSECVFFSEIWDSIYIHKGYGWNKNPYVVVYEFERIEI